MNHSIPNLPDHVSIIDKITYLSEFSSDLPDIKGSDYE
jgi:hypothetical protein